MSTRQTISHDHIDDLAEVIEQAARYDDGAAAKMHLAAGRPIYFSDADTPPDMVTKKYPDGRREFVRFDLNGENLVQPTA